MSLLLGRLPQNDGELWVTDGFHEAVQTHVIIDDEELASRKDYEKLAKKIQHQHRSDYEPQTLDFSLSDLPSAYQKAQDLTLEANKTFGFELSRWQQPLRFNNYGTGQQFKLHNDYAQNDNSKLAFVHMIEEPLEGGELVLVSSPSAIKVRLRHKQTIFFPAYLMHQVLPITKGKRLVLVGWATGRKFS